MCRVVYATTGAWLLLGQYDSGGSLGGTAGVLAAAAAAAAAP